MTALVLGLRGPIRWASVEFAFSGYVCVLLVVQSFLFVLD